MVITSYRRSTIDPDDGCLFRIGDLSVYEHTLLQVQAQGYSRHEGQHGVQGQPKNIQLFLEQEWREPMGGEYWGMGLEKAGKKQERLAF